MKNISVRILSLMIVMLVALSGLSFVNAAATAVTLSSNSKLVAGDSVTINVSLANGFEGIQGKLEYDTSVFESATMVKAGDWNADLTNNVAVIDRSTAASGTESVATITLKVKDSITVNETTIKISNVKASQSGSTVTANTATITLKKDSSATSGSEEVKANTITSTPSNTQAKVNSAKNTTSNKISTSKSTSSKLPKAGDAASAVIITIVALAVAIGIASFIKYQKNKDIK